MIRIILTAAAFAAASLATVSLATAASAAPPAAQAATPAAKKGMNFDCTKAGNKNKAACKNVTQGGVAAAPAAAARPAAMSKTAAKPPVNAVGAPKTAMNYDCTKAGNKNKSVCKNVVVPPAGASAARPAPAAMPVAAARRAASVAGARTAVPAAPAGTAARPLNPNEVTATQKNGRVVHYDCSKAGNKDKKACGAK